MKLPGNPALPEGRVETLWMYRMDEGEWGENAPRLNSGRGVAFWTDGDEYQTGVPPALLCPSSQRYDPCLHTLRLDRRAG